MLREWLAPVSTSYFLRWWDNILTEEDYNKYNSIYVFVALIGWHLNKYEMFNKIRIDNLIPSFFFLCFYCQYYLDLGISLLRLSEREVFLYLLESRSHVWWNKCCDMCQILLLTHFQLFVTVQSLAVLKCIKKYDDGCHLNNHSKRFDLILGWKELQCRYVRLNREIKFLWHVPYLFFHSHKVLIWYISKQSQKHCIGKYLLSHKHTVS